MKYWVWGIIFWDFSYLVTNQKKKLTAAYLNWKIINLLHKERLLILTSDLYFSVTDDLPRMRFKCPFCTHTVKRRADLKRHLRCHTGERPYPCEACGKRFTRLEHLRNHFQTVRLSPPGFSLGKNPQDFTGTSCSVISRTNTRKASYLHINFNYSLFKLANYIFLNFIF